ncbi:MAG: hypothetical protein RLZZ531_1343 [Bacteroidota bacterium]
MTVEEALIARIKKPKFTEWHRHFVAHPEQIPDLVNLALGSKKAPLPAHASWLLIHLAKADWTLLASYEHAFIDHFLQSTNQSILRNLLVSLLEFPLTDYLESDFLDALITHVKNEENKVALRVYSLCKLTEFVQRYPEIKVEIDAVIELIQEHPMSPAMKVGIRNFEKMCQKMLGKLNV